MTHLQEAGHSQVVHQLQLWKLQLSRVAGEQQLPPHLSLLDHGDLNLFGVLLQNELIPQERGASCEHHFVSGHLQLVDTNGYVAEAPLVSQEIHLLEHAVAKCGKAELQDHLVLGHSEQIPNAPEKRTRYGEAHQTPPTTNDGISETWQLFAYTILPKAFARFP